MAKQRVTQTLDERIRAALTDDAVTSVELENLYEEIEAAVPAAQQQAAAAHEQALDPLTEDVAGARAAAQDYQIRVQRLQGALPRLGQRLATVRQREEYGRWLPEYEAVAAERDAQAQTFAERYPALVAELVALFQGNAAIDAQVQRVNGAAANLLNEHRRLLSVELTARKLTGFTGSAPSLAEKVQLPAFDDPGRMLWPPRTVPAAVLIAEGVARAMSGVPSPVHDLAGYHAAQDAARRAEAERSAHYYQGLNEEREEEERTTRIAEQEAMFSE
jgi:hypothetical protein